MSRQKTKISDRFGSGGNKDGSPEEKFFTDPDIQIDPEWKAMELLRSQIDDITDAINANDAGSGSFAGDIKTLYITSQSFSSRVTTNDAKTGITSTQADRITANHAKVGITTSQASAITANSAKTGITSTQAGHITTNNAKTGITSTQASQITANNAKVGTETDLSDTEGMTLKATVALSRGVYTLTFTVTHDRVTKTANITMS